MSKLGRLAACAACLMFIASKAAAQAQPAQPPPAQPRAASPQTARAPLREPWYPDPDLAVGAKVYAERCASCHDSPGPGRTPARAALLELTATHIEAVMS